MRLSKNSNSSRGEVDSGAQPREDRQAYRQTDRDRHSTEVPSHTCSGRVKSGRRVYQEPSVGLGHARSAWDNGPVSSASRAESSQIESRVTLGVRSRSELNRKLCRGAGLWRGTTVAAVRARSTGSRFGFEVGLRSGFQRRRVDVDTCARKQLESTHDPVQFRPLQSGPVQSNPNRRANYFRSSRLNTGQLEAESVCSVMPRQRGGQGQTKPEKLGERADGHGGKGLTVSKYLGTCPQLNLKNPPRSEGEVGMHGRGWGSRGYVPPANMHPASPPVPSHQKGVPNYPS